MADTVRVIVVTPGIYNGEGHRANPFAQAGDIIAVAGGWYAETLIAAGYVRYPDAPPPIMTITVNTGGELILPLSETSLTEGELILPLSETSLTEGESEPPSTETGLTKSGIPIDAPEAVELRLGQRRGRRKNAP